MTETPITEITLKDNRRVTVRAASDTDMNGIRKLYYDVYGGRYTLDEVNDKDKMKWVIHDPNYLWLVALDAEQIVGSLIFVADPLHRVGKLFAGVVHPQYQGKHLLQNMLKFTVTHELETENRVDLMYAVHRTVSLAPQIVLDKMGFVGLGIFPNVHRVRKFETHGLKAIFHQAALENRITPPKIIPQVYPIFKITGKLLNLGEGVEIFDSPLPDHPEARIEFLIERSKEVEWEYYETRDQGDLMLDYFPFHYPNVKLYTKDQDTQVFMVFHPSDGHACLLGLKTTRADLINVLNATADYAESLGSKYLEVLIPAQDPVLQKLAYRAYFLPCAYFPAFKLGPEGKRLDYIVASRSFVPINFKGVHLDDQTRPYLLAFYKIYSNRLLEDIESDI